MAQEIKIQPEHLALIKNCYIQYEDGIEYGGFAQDPKRPYGNSSVLPDIREIFEEEGFDAYSDEQLHQFHRELRYVLTISIQEQSWDIVGRTYESLVKRDEAFCKKSTTLDTSQAKLVRTYPPGHPIVCALGGNF